MPRPPADPAPARPGRRRDAVLSHTGNGVYGAMVAAALLSAAFTSPTVLPWEETPATVSAQTAGLGWIRTVPDAAVLTAGLLYGDGGFTRAIALTVRGGPDTDSGGAPAGSVAGVLNGAAAIPDRWKDRFRTRSAARCSASTASGSARRPNAPRAWLPFLDDHDS